MIIFTLAAASAYIALALWTTISGTTLGPDQPETVWVFVCMLPVLVTFIVADAARLVRPRWTLDRRARRGMHACAAGLFAGALGAAGVSALLAATTAVPSPVIFVGCPAFATLLAVAPMRRLRAGWCVTCGYDLRAATVRTGAQCPECGRVEA